jgi:acyl-CoA thioester hydrolase
MPEHHQPNAKKFVFHIRVYYEDTDAGGVVYYANYLRFMERARTEWLRSLGFDQAPLMDAGIAFAARSVNAEYLKPARLDDELTVISVIESLGRAQVTFGQRILRGEELLVDAKIRIACLGLRKGKAAAMPREIYEQFKAQL